MFATLGDVVPRKITSSELIREGYLVPARIVFTHYYPKYGGNYVWSKGGRRLYNVIKKRIYGDPVRNRLIASIAKNVPKPFMIIVKEIWHGKLIEKECRKQGLNIRFLHGQINPEIRRKVFDMVRKQQIDGIVVTTLGDEGLDLPALRTLILAGEGKSPTKAYQRVGRALRPFPGKKEALVVDIHTHARYFEQHGWERRKIYLYEKEWKIEDITFKT